jgi:hypothetical protein
MTDTELGSRERDLLDAYRDHHAMPADKRARVWASLAVGPGGGGGGGSTIESASEPWVTGNGVVAASGWSRSSRIAVAGLVVAAGITLIVLGVASSREPSGLASVVRVEASAGESVEPSLEPIRVSARRSAPMPAPMPEPLPLAAPAQTLETDPHAAPRPRVRARSKPALESPVPAPSLGRERELIEQAHAALAEGDTEAALAALDEHARSFATGVFAEEREGLDAIARCKAGQLELGRARAQAFLDGHPRAVLAARIRRTCDIEGSTSEGP